jgi:hypothetical protein
MKVIMAVVAWLWMASASWAQVSQEVVFRVGQNADIDWFVINNPAIRGTLNVTNAPYANTTDLNGAAVDQPFAGGRNRLIFAATAGTSVPPPTNGYAINLAGLTLLQNGATPVTVTFLGAWDTGVDDAGYRKADGQVYYSPINTDQLRRLNFGPTGLITGFTNMGNYNGGGTPNSVTMGDIDFAADGSMWVAGNNADTNPVVPTLWNFNFTTLNALSTLLTGGEVFNGMTFNAAGDTLYGYKQTTGQYGVINQATGGFQTVLDTDLSEFGVLGDLATGTAIVVTGIPEPSTLGLVGLWVIGSGFVIRRSRSRKSRLGTVPIAGNSEL